MCLDERKAVLLGKFRKHFHALVGALVLCLSLTTAIAETYPGYTTQNLRMLDWHLADIEEQAQELFLRLVEQYADTEGVTEALKADDPMAWVRKMNNIRNRANEAVMQEIVYG